MTFHTSPNDFPDLVELDSLRLTVIVDNEVDIMTSVPRELGQTSQALKLYKDQRHLDKEKSSPPTDHAHPGVSTVAFDFNDLCCGAHGLSILVVSLKKSGCFRTQGTGFALQLNKIFPSLKMFGKKN